MRGCSKQLYSYNFLSETVNIRWLRYCADAQQPSNSAPPPFLTSDISQSCKRQPKSGRSTMLTSSKIYWHENDRTLCPREYFMQNGWERDIELTDVNEPVVGWPTSDKRTRQMPRAPASVHAVAPPESPSTKRRRVSHPPKQRCKGLAATVVDLAANGMALPDLALITYTSLLSTRDGVFEQQPDLGFTFRGSASGSATGFHFQEGSCWHDTMQEVIKSLGADADGDTVDVSTDEAAAPTEFNSD